MKIDFFDCYEIDVSFEIEDRTYNGCIVIDNKSVSILNPENVDDHLIYAVSNSILKTISCNQKNGFETFILHGIHIFNEIIHFEFLTSGSNELHSYNSIKIGLTGITTWLGEINDAKINGMEITKDNTVEKVSAPFKIDNQKYVIENSRDYYFRSINEGRYLLEIDDFIIIKSSDYLGLDKVKEIILNIVNLFSVLTGVALSIKSIQLADTKDDIKTFLFFDYVQYEKYPLKSMNSALINFFQIKQKNMWGDILNNYFSNNFLMEFIPKLSYLIGSKFDAWEYEIFAVIVLLEKCCDSFSKEVKKSLPKNEINGLKSFILDKFDFYIEKNLSHSNNHVLDSIREGIKGLKNTSIISLSDKIDAFLRGIESEIINIVGLNDSEIALAKKIRNKISHGESYAPSEKNDITKEFLLKNKLMIVLIYCAFSRLGINDNECWSVLFRSSNRFVRDANLNRREIDRFSGRFSFIEITGSVSTELVSKSHFLIAINCVNGIYHVDETLTSYMLDKLDKGNITNVESFVGNEIDLNTHNFKCIYFPYITINNNEERWHWAALIEEK